jgi:uncharacterized protein YjbI with pentapeptide repeats
MARASAKRRRDGMAGRIVTALALVALATAVPAQTPTQGVALDSPAMIEAELTREEVVARLAAPGGSADLSRLHLNGLDLQNLDFSGATLRASRLNGANLTGAILDGADLGQAWLLGANLEGASLRGAQLFQTQLGGANLRGADLTGARAVADFSRADLTGALFVGADLAPDMRNQSMGLMRGVLSNAEADGADFTGARMTWADLEFGSFRGARFIDADLRLARLGGADFTGATVTGANFTGADIASARLIALEGAEPSTFDAAQNRSRAFFR